MDSRVIANLFLLLFLGVADNQMIAPLLPSLVDSFHISVGVAGLLVVGYSVAAAVAAFLSGTFSDRYGRRRFLLAGVLVFSLASWAASHSATFLGLVLARALTGLAAGTLSTCAIVFAADWFAYGVRGRAIGLISSAYFAAPIVGVPLAAQIADRFGWRRTFLFFAILALVVAALSLTLPAERVSPQPSAEKPRNTVGAFRSFLSRTRHRRGSRHRVSGVRRLGWLSHLYRAVVEQPVRHSNADHWMGLHAGRSGGRGQRTAGGNGR